MRNQLEKSRFLLTYFFKKGFNQEFNKHRLKSDEEIENFINSDIIYFSTRKFERDILNFYMEKRKKSIEMFMEYFFGNEKISYEKLSEKYGTSAVKACGISRSYICMLHHDSFLCDRLKKHLKIQYAINQAEEH